MNTFDILFAVTSGLMGLIGGWLLRQCVGPALPASDDRVPDQRSNAELRESLDFRRDQVATAVDRVKSLTLRVAADVQDHDQVLQQARLALTEPDSDEGIKSAVMELAVANEKMRKQLSDAKIRMEEQAAQLQTAEEKARTDGLTQLQNRRAFDEYVQQQFNLFRQANTPSSLMLIDVDHFKAFNDTHGHLAGDHVLRGVADHLKAQLGDQAFLARYGGEEFAIVFAGRDSCDVEYVAEQARLAIGRKVLSFDGKSLKVTVSGGLAHLEDAEPLERWIERADEGLYSAKEAGRNCAFRMVGSTAHPMTESQETEAEVEEPVSETPDWLAEVTGERVPQRRRDPQAQSEQQRPDDELVVSNDVFNGLQPPDSVADLPAGEELLKIGRRQLHSAHRQNNALSAFSVRVPDDDEQLMARIVRALETTDCSVDRYGMLTGDRFLVWLPDTSEEEARRRVGVLHELLSRPPILPQLDAVHVEWATAEVEEPFETFLERLIGARVVTPAL